MESERRRLEVSLLVLVSATSEETSRRLLDQLNKVYEFSDTDDTDRLDQDTKTLLEMQDYTFKVRPTTSGGGVLEINDGRVRGKPSL